MIQHSSTASIDAVISDHLDTFCEVFQLKADKVDRFGGMDQDCIGFDDDNHGVQWNTAVNFKDSHLASGDLGVNLEGNKYDDYPVERLIRRERRDFSLFKIVASIEHRENIKVRWTRDVWANQRRRVDLQPFLYVHLSELTEPEWQNALATAQSCLNLTKNGWERAWQKTTVKDVNSRPTCTTS